MEECENICLLGNIGYSLKYDIENNIFRVVTRAGIDRSVAQNVNDHIVFRTSMKTLMTNLIFIPLWTMRMLS